MEILKEQYEKEVIPALMKKFNYKSIMEVPRLDKIVINSKYISAYRIFFIWCAYFLLLFTDSSWNYCLHRGRG